MYSYNKCKDVSLIFSVSFYLIQNSSPTEHEEIESLLKLCKITEVLLPIN